MVRGLGCVGVWELISGLKEWLVREQHEGRVTVGLTDVTAALLTDTKATPAPWKHQQLAGGELKS